MPSTLTSQFQHAENGTLIITLAGRLDGNSSPEFGRDLAAQLNPAATGAILEVGALEFISSAGLRELMTLARTLHKNKGKAVLVAVPPPVHEVLDISGMSSLFLRAGGRDEALRLLAGGGLLGRLFKTAVRA
jgi:anti-anti-sigma factor